jgi:glycosyltransferase involved in cell wall biosynthesis
MTSGFMARIVTWRAGLVRAVQRRMLGLPPDHPLRRAHRMLRTVPLVSFVWRRVLKAGAKDYVDMASYRRKGGTFARPAPEHSCGPAAGQLPNLPRDWRFLAAIAQGAAGEPAYDPVRGRAVLVNCSAAAGGAERQLVHTLEGLRARGVDAIFLGEFIRSGDSALDFHLPRLEAAGVPVERADPGPLPGPALYAGVTEAVAAGVSGFDPDPAMRLLGMVRHLRALRPEVVHLWQDQTSVLHGLAALIARVPRIVLSGRNLDPTHFDFFLPWMHPGYLVLAAHPHVILTNNSQAGADSYARWLGLPPERVEVILNGTVLAPLPAPEVRWAARTHLAQADTPLLVAGVFRMSPEKRPLLWIETAAEVLRLVPDARFVVAGDGPMMEEVRAHARACALDGKLRFLGETQDVHLLQGAADVLLLTSQQEGTPNVLLEAQGLDTPVVSTDAGGAAACVLAGQTGHVVPSGQDGPQQLAHAVVQAAGLAPLLRASGAGRAFIESRFGLARMLDETLAAYGFGPAQAVVKAQAPAGAAPALTAPARTGTSPARLRS